MSGEAKAGRLRELDFLRWVAVLLVLFRHIRGLGDPGQIEWLRKPVEILARGGWIGVDLFFVLSGFLVSGLLFREYQSHGELRIGRFFLRRGFKIYPAFYLFIGTVIFRHWRRGEGMNWERVTGELLFVQNYLGGLRDHTWSLAVEEHFYIALPLLLAGMLRFWGGGLDPFRRLPAIFVGCAVVLLGLRIWANLPVEPLAQANYARTHLRLDSLFFGVLISYAHHFHGDRLRAWWGRNRGWCWAGAVAALIPPWILDLGNSFYLRTFGFGLLYLAFGVVLLGVLYGGLPRGGWLGRAVGAMAWIGASSYSIYLWHVDVNLWCIALALERLHWPMWAGWILYFTASLAVGVALSKGVEWPILAIRDRWFPSRAQGMSVSAAVADQGR